MGLVKVLLRIVSTLVARYRLRLGIRMGLIGGFSCPLKVLWRHGDSLHSKGSLEIPLKGEVISDGVKRALDNRVYCRGGEKGVAIIHHRY